MAGLTNINYHSVDKVNIKVRQDMLPSSQEPYDILSIEVTCSDGSHQNIDLFGAFNQTIDVRYLDGGTT
jgi:hypothetical protein|tara:strand:- start:129 stop:335 length:207 start_codon:yes stop_codon:yes gene_type:complete